MTYVKATQAFDLGSKNEPYRLKNQCNSLSLKLVKAGRSLEMEGYGAGSKPTATPPGSCKRHERTPGLADPGLMSVTTCGVKNLHK